MQKLFRIFSRLTEGVAALMMAAIFLTFLLQIAVRYIVGSEWFSGQFGHLIDAADFGWTVEFIMVMWLWVIFWSNAFIVRERDHVTFDILYNSVRPTVRKWFAVVGSLIIMVALWSSIDPTYTKMRLLWIKSSATLPVKMMPIYSIYFLFLAVVGLRYAYRAYDVFRNGAEQEAHLVPGDHEA